VGNVNMQKLKDLVINKASKMERNQTREIMQFSAE